MLRQLIPRGAKVIVEVVNKPNTSICYGFCTTQNKNQEIDNNSTSQEKIKLRDLKYRSGKSMKAWEINSYGGINDLQLTSNAKFPLIKNPKDVIVRVYASSVNPIDVRMTEGYGSGTINVLRHFDSSAFYNAPSLSKALNALNPTTATGHTIEFPLILGRDFAGVITEVGNDVKELKIGDKVFGAIGVQRNGSHAEYVLASSEFIRRIPKSLNFLEAASLPYVGLTAWSAIHITGGYTSLSGKKFLILGGSGGVGTFAIQYLRALGAYVVSTCSQNALELVGAMGCHFVIDYKDPDFMSYIQKQAPFDCIYDFAGGESRTELLKFLSPACGQYITLSPPFVSNVDKYGVLGGLASSFGTLAVENLKSLNEGKVLTKWAFFIPCENGLDAVTSMANSGKVKPVIQEIFKFENLPQAYEKLKAGHTRGKIVIDFN